MIIVGSGHRRIGIGMTLALAILGAGELRGQGTASGDLVATIQGSKNYTVFARLLGVAHLAPALQGPARFTVFAPTDSAFAKVPKPRLAALEADTVQLKKVLLRHIVSNAIPANKALGLRSARTLGGSKVEFSVRDARLHVNNAVIIHPDIIASNGLIHGIDAVMIP